MCKKNIFFYAEPGILLVVYVIRTYRGFREQGDKGKIVRTQRGRGMAMRTSAYKGGGGQKALLCAYVLNECPFH